MKNYVISLDVGGTSVKAGLVDENLNLLESSIRTYPSKSDECADAIIDNFVYIINDMSGQDNVNVIGVAMGFPGPFDYENGVCFIKGLAKYESLYGINIRDRIKAKLPEDLPMKFENDATVFAYGEYLKGKANGYKRVIFITLGTGCGSTFLENGRKVAGEYGVPESGMIFDQPFKEGIIDDYISRRYFLKLAQEQGFSNIFDVKEIDRLARSGDKTAQEVFDDFGSLLGEALIPYVEKFSADLIIFGGGLSKGYDLFEKTFLNVIGATGVSIQISNDLSKSALIGIASLVI